MVKHIILWQLKDELSAEEKEAAKKAIKEGLEGLKDQIPEICQIKVNINGLETSNADVMLDSSFKTAEDLAAYANHPKHVAVATGVVKPNTKSRTCLDFEEQCL